MEKDTGSTSRIRSTRAIAAARVKTDSVDARTLAHLLRTDLLPEAYIAPREIRDLRDLLRHGVASYPRDLPPKVLSCRRGLARRFQVQDPSGTRASSSSRPVPRCPSTPASLGRISTSVSRTRS
jgi:predicted metal-dependent phosphoesterase TrpH